MILAAWIALLSDKVYFIGVSSRGLISWIVLGLIAGWIAGHLARGRGFGCIVDVILGLIGAVIGGWIFTRLGIPACRIPGQPRRGHSRRVLLVLIARLFCR